jgi:hypothetical protein
MLVGSQVGSQISSQVGSQKKGEKNEWFIGNHKRCGRKAGCRRTFYKF